MSLFMKEKIKKIVSKIGKFYSSPFVIYFDPLKLLKSIFLQLIKALTVIIVVIYLTRVLGAIPFLLVLLILVVFIYMLFA